MISFWNMNSFLFFVCYLLFIDKIIFMNVHLNADLNFGLAKF